MSPHLLTRRALLERLAKLGVALAATPTLGLSACGGDAADTVTEPPEIPLPPPRADIEGPFEMYLDGSDGPLSIPYGVGDSEGDTFEWAFSRVDGGVLATAAGMSTTVLISQVGSYRMRLEVAREGHASAVATKDVVVRPALSGPWDGRRRLAYFRFTPGQEGSRELLIAEDYRSPLVAGVTPAGDFSGQKISWNPDQTKFATTRYHEFSGNQVVLVDPATMDVTVLSDNPDTSVAQHACWSPDGSWIAYLDDSKTISQGRDWIMLVRPDGSERTQIGGSNDDQDYASTLAFAWTLDGQAIVHGGTLSQEEKDRRIFRMLVLRDPAGDHFVERLFPDEALADFLTDHGYGDVPLDRVDMGNRTGAVLAHPNGQDVLFNLDFLWNDGSHAWTVSTSLDGTGPLKLVATIAGDSTLSPDGNTLIIRHTGFFDERLPTGEIGRLPASGGPIERLTPDTGYVYSGFGLSN